MRRLNRIDPRLGAQAFKTYSITAPLETHWRPATCAEFGCKAHEFGWRTQVDESSDLGQRQAHYIRKESGRRFREERTGDAVTTFTFEAGQRCFTPHKVRVDRQEVYRVRDGDWRGNPTGRVYTHTRPSDWVDDFATHRSRLADQR